MYDGWGWILVEEFKLTHPKIVLPWQNIHSVDVLALSTPDITDEIFYNHTWRAPSRFSCYHPAYQHARSSIPLDVYRPIAIVCRAMQLRPAM